MRRYQIAIAWVLFWLTPPALVSASQAADGDGQQDASPQAGAQEHAACAARFASLRQRLDAEIEDCRDRERLLVAKYESQILTLRRELREERVRREEREHEWLSYTKALAVLDLAPEPFTVERGSAEEGAGKNGSGGEPSDPIAERSRQVLRILRSLFKAEQVAGLDLLEAGRVAEGYTGPVVLRLLDPAGRPVGSLSAERLRLEASRSGKTLTLVFEEGYERRAGSVIPFDGPLVSETVLTQGQVVASEAALRKGVRRIVLPRVDPEPWFEALPELFGEQLDAPVPDDGHWNRELVRIELNRLLREDIVGGYYRLHGLGGVKDLELRDVQLEELDPEGRLQRRLFADRMRIVAQDRGVLLFLESGVQMRGGNKVPFLDGRYRIFLPRARLEAWRKAQIPLFEREPKEPPLPDLVPAKKASVQLKD